MGSTLRLVTVVFTSKAPSARLYVISYSWAKGHCAIRSGFLQNSRRLVTCAERASAATSVTRHNGELTSNPWIGMLPRTLPNSMLNVYFLPLAQKAGWFNRSAHGARKGIPESLGRCWYSPTSAEGKYRMFF